MQFSIKYRPKKFSDVVGQEHAVRILQNTILMNRVPHALLISGIHGIGKTTLARIYAKALNCEKILLSAFSEYQDACEVCSSCTSPELHLVELDAASNNGVDDVRNLEQVSRQKPVGAYRVFVLDEAHMLTGAAQAAFLKLLEEPPEKTVFILVTTEPQKLTDTVRSRCMSLELRPLSVKEIEDNIRTISQIEELGISDEVVSAISNLGGSLRDIQQVLERVSLYDEAGHETEQILDFLGIISIQKYKTLARVLDAKDLRFGIESINQLYRSGVDLNQLFFEGIPNLLSDFSSFLSCKDDDEFDQLSSRIHMSSRIPIETLKSNLYLSLEDVKTMIKEWEDLYEVAKNTNNMRSIWIIYMTKIFINELETGMAITP